MDIVFDSKRLFDEEKFSDITIKLGNGREFKCHKIIICEASEYFQRLCGPNSKFKEAHQDAIELKGDDPKAAEAVLRHLYNFKYGEIMLIIDNFTIEAQVNVILCAQKYLLSKLEHQAKRALSEQLGSIEIICKEDGDATNLLNALEVLSANTECCDSFAGRIDEIVANNSAALFNLPRFRSLLETEPWKQALRICSEAMARGQVRPASTSRARHTMTCLLCGDRNSAKSTIYACRCGNQEPTWFNVTIDSSSL